MSLFNLSRIEEFYLFQSSEKMEASEFKMIYRWCKDQFGAQNYEKDGLWCVYENYIGSQTTFRFTDPSYAMAFRLRWC